jgi:hypothetical protein
MYVSPSSSQVNRSPIFLRALGLGLVVFLFFFCNHQQASVFDFLSTKLLPRWLPREVSPAQLLNYTFLLFTTWVISVNVILSLLLIYVLSTDWKYTRLAAILFAGLGILIVVFYVIKRLWFNTPGTYLSDTIYFLKTLLDTPLLAVLLGVSYHMRKSGTDL